MRTDVKIAIVLSVVVVGVAAYYFSLPGDQDIRIEGSAQLAEGPPSADARASETGSSGKTPGGKAAWRADQGRESRRGAQVRSRTAPDAPSSVQGSGAGEDGVAGSGGSSQQLGAKAEDGKTNSGLNKPAALEGPLPPLSAPFSSEKESAETVEVSVPERGVRVPEARGPEAAHRGPAGPEPLPKRMDHPTSAVAAIATDRPAAEIFTTGAPSVSVKVKATEAAKTHVVQAGETFSSLATKYYGSERYTRFLLAQNPQISDPRMLRVGDKLRIPALSVAKAKVPGAPAKKAAGAGQYLVKKDDTFYTIAASTLGDGTRWPEIYELNRDTVGDRPTNLRAGQMLELPAEAKKGR